MATFGEQLRVWREARGLKQEDVAAAMGVRQQTVGGWEASGHRPKVPRLGALAEVLGISQREIMDAYIETANDEPPERLPAPARPVIEHMLAEMLSWQERLSEQMQQIALLVEAVRAEMRGQPPAAPPTAPSSPTSRRQRPGPR